MQIDVIPLGKGEVESSIPSGSTINRLEFIGFIDRPCGVLMLEQALNVSAMTSICECSSSAVDLVSDATQRGRISSAIWHDGHA